MRNAEKRNFYKIREGIVNLAKTYDCNSEPPTDGAKPHLIEFVVRSLPLPLSVRQAGVADRCRQTGKK